MQNLSFLEAKIVSYDHGCKSRGGAWGAWGASRGLSPLEILLMGLAMEPAPPEKTGFSPPTFRNMRGLTRLIVTISPSTFFSYS